MNVRAEMRIAYIVIALLSSGCSSRLNLIIHNAIDSPVTATVLAQGKRLETGEIPPNEKDEIVVSASSGDTVGILAYSRNSIIFRDHFTIPEAKQSHEPKTIKIIKQDSKTYADNIDGYLEKFGVSNRSVEDIPPVSLSGLQSILGSIYVVVRKDNGLSTRWVAYDQDPILNPKDTGVTYDAMSLANQLTSKQTRKESDFVVRPNTSWKTNILPLLSITNESTNSRVYNFEISGNFSVSPAIDQSLKNISENIQNHFMSSRVEQRRIVEAIKNAASTYCPEYSSYKDIVERCSNVGLIMITRFSYIEKALSSYYELEKYDFDATIGIPSDLMETIELVTDINGTLAYKRSSESMQRNEIQDKLFNFSGPAIIRPEIVKEDAGASGINRKDGEVLIPTDKSGEYLLLDLNGLK